MIKNTILLADINEELYFVLEIETKLENKEDSCGMCKGLGTLSVAKSQILLPSFNKLRSL